MPRITKARINRINPDKIADEAEYYLEGHKLYQKELTGIRGMATPLRIKNSIKKIDQLAREAMRLEEKIDRLVERRAIEATKLQDTLTSNTKLAKKYLTPEEFSDFRG